MLKTRILFGSDGMIVEKETLELTPEEEIALRQYERSLRSDITADYLKDSIISPEMN